MRTYLPYSDFRKCAECFSLKRLTKQRHDALEVLYLLSGRRSPNRGSRFMYNSPAVKVWRFCPMVLVHYGLVLCDEYEKRTGKVDPVRDRLARQANWFRRNYGWAALITEPPKFLESEAMQKSHRAILARQEPEHYAKFGFTCDPNDEKVFYWPVEEAETEFAEIASCCQDECNCDACIEAREEGPTWN
jgi:hypothetical protein